MGVQDAPGIGAVDGLGQDRPEPGHDHHVDVVTLEHLGERSRVGRTVESGTEATESGPVDQLDRHPVVTGHVQGPAGPVGHHQPDGQIGGKDGLQNGAAPRYQYPDAEGTTRVAAIHGGTLPAR